MYILLISEPEEANMKWSGRTHKGQFGERDLAARSDTIDN